MYNHFFEHILSSGTSSFTITPSVIPSSRSTNLTIALVGTGTSWVNGTTGFSTTGVTGIAEVSTTVIDSTHANVVLSFQYAAPPNALPTGTLTLTETGTGSSMGTVSVQTPTMTISPNSGPVNTTPSITATGVNTLWNHTTLYSPITQFFTVSGGTGSSTNTTQAIGDTISTFILTVGTAPATLTIQDNSTGAQATFTVVGSGSGGGISGILITDGSDNSGGTIVLTSGGGHQ